MATQDADAAIDLADRVIVLQAGRIGLQGTPEQVFVQVQALHSLGVDAPQVAELTWRMGLRPACLSVDQAARILPQTRPRSSPEDAASSPDRRDKANLRDFSPLQECVVAFEDVWYRYETNAQALTGVNLSIRGNEFVALVGANGSGKTTLAKHVNGLLQPQHGRVLVAGTDSRETTTGVLAQKVGFVFQNPDHQIFAPSVREEVAFGPRNLGLSRAEVERRVEAALGAFCLTSAADLPPATLGYGQRRLVTLAAVHAMQPQVLILDEPTVGLDRPLTHRLVEWVSELHRGGTTTLVITHDMRLAALAQRCVVMNQGQIALDSPVAEVFTDTDSLERAGIVAPPIVELSRRLRLPALTLSASDLSQAWAGLVEEAEAP
jgi:energy-coupling factor transport system ATP-binding protein